jgi:hypothetical protein
MLEPTAIQQVEPGTSAHSKLDVIRNSFDHSALIVFIQSPISKNPIVCRALTRSNTDLQPRPAWRLESARKWNPAKVQIRGGSISYDSVTW